MLREQMTIFDAMSGGNMLSSLKMGEVVKLMFDESQADDLDKLYVEHYVGGVVGKRGRVTGSLKNGVYEVKMECDGSILYWYGHDLIPIYK